MKNILILAGIVILAAVLRLYDIGKLPNGLHWDEQDTGYQAYSLLKTGKDYFGNTLPLFPHSFADFRTPVFIYSSVPIVKFLGLTPFSVRLPSAISGVLSVILIFYLAKQLWNWKTGQLASLVLALSPWHILYGRQSVECNIMLPYLLLSLITFYKGLKNPRWLVLSGLFFGLTSATYSPAKFFAPVLLIALFIIHYSLFKNISRKILFKSIFLFSLIFIPILIQSTFGPAGTRFHDLSIFTDPQVGAVVDLQRQTSSISHISTPAVGLSPSLLDKLSFNKPGVWLNSFLSNYLNTYSTEFLFTKGDQELRHSPSHDFIGQLYLIEIIPLLLGLIFLRNRLILFWFLVGPIPSALTRGGGPHAARAFLLLPAFALTIALGISKLKKFLPVYWILYLGSCIFFLNYFFGTYRLESAHPFQWGYDQMVKIASSRSADYDHVFVDVENNTALMAYLFNLKVDPVYVQSHQPLPVVEPFPDSQAVILNNIYLMRPGTRRWDNLKPSGKNLVIASFTLPFVDKYEPKQTILFPDFTPAFYVFEK